MLVDISSLVSVILLCGDYNIHVDDLNSSYAQSFSNLLDSFNLKQHVVQPTHSTGHTLDLLISRTDSTLVSDCTIRNPLLSDHFAVLFTLTLPCCVRPSARRATFRNISKINLRCFSDDIRSSDLYTLPATNLSEFLTRFTNTVTSLLNKHAPLKSVNCSTKRSQSFITPEIRKAKSLRSRLETIYRKSKSDSDKENFKQQSRFVSKLITHSKRKYFRDLISESKHDRKKLWSNLNSLLHRNSRPALPSFISSKSMASSFMKFFLIKSQFLILSLILILFLLTLLHH